MSVWIEFRCSMAHEPCADEVRTSSGDVERCFSHDNSGAMDMANANQKSIIETYKFLAKISERDGWKKINGEWVCPHCVKNLHKNKQD